MLNNETTKPLLVEPGIKYFLHESLKKCSEYKDKYKNYVYNVGIFIIFITIVAAILIYKYKGKLTDKEIYKKEQEKKMYILSKIKNYQDAKRTAQQQLITSLPQWETENDVLRGARY